MTQKKQPRDSILGRVAQSKALCTQKSQHLLSKGHQTDHSGLKRFRHISVMYESAIKDQLRRHPIFMGNSYLATEQVNSSQLKCLYAECKHMSLENV